MPVCRGGNRRPFGDQEAVGGDAKRGVVMEASPAATLIVAEAEFLLEVLVVALDTPAQLGQMDQVAQPGGLGQGGEPVFGRLGLARRPFDEQPLLGPQRCSPIVAVRGTNAHRGEA